MTLRVEFSDSETGETSCALRRAPQDRTLRRLHRQRFFRKDGYSYWRAVRANLSRWSELVRQRMHDQRARNRAFLSGATTGS